MAFETATVQLGTPPSVSRAPASALRAPKALMGSLASHLWHDVDGDVVMLSTAAKTTPPSSLRLRRRLSPIVRIDLTSDNSDNAQDDDCMVCSPIGRGSDDTSMFQSEADKLFEGKTYTEVFMEVCPSAYGLPSPAVPANTKTTVAATPMDTAETSFTTPKRPSPLKVDLVVPQREGDNTPCDPINRASDYTGAFASAGYSLFKGKTFTEVFMEVCPTAYGLPSAATAPTASVTNSTVLRKRRRYFSPLVPCTRSYADAFGCDNEVPPLKRQKLAGTFTFDQAHLVRPIRVRSRSEVEDSGAEAPPAKKQAKAASDMVGPITRSCARAAEASLPQPSAKRVKPTATAPANPATYSPVASRTRSKRL